MDSIIKGANTLHCCQNIEVACPLEFFKMEDNKGAGASLACTKSKFDSQHSINQG